jgi:DNA-binding SARP family transcriptional activator/tetratricopeptide (TPR) repeat protein
MFFGYLGPLLIGTGEAGAVVPTPRQRTVLAVLLARAGRPVAVDELAEFVWDGKPPDRAADTLRTYVMRLRRTLGDAAGARIMTRDPGYLIEVGEEEVDALRFARACRDGAAAYGAGQWATARTALAGGLALWRGDPLADVPSQLLRDAEVPALHRLRLQALHWRIDADLQLGGGAELVAELQELTSREPLDEQLHALLMTALARCGRAGAALGVYQQARDLLVGQLGIEPGPELRELQRLILAGNQVMPRAIARVSPDARPAARQLPAPAGPFAGRAAELKTLDAVLAQTGTEAVRISAIGGMAGIGKTTLALHWAHQVAGKFPDGQLYVDLRGFGPAAPMTPADALRGFLDALRDPARPLPQDPDAQGALYRSLMAGRRMLVVLDNARDEQQVRPLLPGSASCLTLITSRSQLAGLVATNGAVPLSLDLLTEAEARELLSRRLGPERTTAEPAAVDQLIAACTGLPLALCITAARAAVAPGFPLAALAAQISRPGLDALSGTDPYADLRSVFSWSCQRLSPDAARLFRCLPAFPGPDVSAAAAASITPAGRADGLLAELTSAHLLEEYVPGRFRLHDLLARYAQERSEQDDTEETRREAAQQILTWYTAAATMAKRIANPTSPHIRQAGQPDPVPAGLATSTQALEWLEAERRNLVAAVERAARLGFDTMAVTLSLTLWGLFEQRAHWNGWLDTNVIGIEAARRTGDLDAEAHLCSSLSRAYIALGRAEEGIADLHRAIAIRQTQGDLSGLAASRLELSIVYFEMGRVTEAISECEQAAAMARESGNLRGEAHALSDLGEMHQRVAEPEKALNYHLAAQAIAAQVSSPLLAGAVQANLAGIYLELGRNDEAIAAATAAIELNEQSGNRVEQGNSHRVLGDALHLAGQRADACSHWRAALAMYQELGDPRAEKVAATLASAVAGNADPVGVVSPAGGADVSDLGDG